MNEIESQSPDAGARRGGGCGKIFLIGCLLILLLGGAAAVYVVMNFESIAVSFFRKIVVTSIENQNLPEDQKKRIVAQVNRLTDDYKAGKIDGQDLQRVLQEIMESPLFAAGMVLVVEQKYVEPSGLSEPEKAEARLSLKRFARGVVDGRIDGEVVKDVAEPARKSKDGENFDLKDRLTDDELRELIAGARAHADEAGIENEDYSVDIADELEKAVQRALDGSDPPAMETESESTDASSEAEPK